MITRERWNPRCPLLGRLWKGTPFVCMAAGENGVNPTLLMPRPRKGWEAGVEGQPVCCRLHQPGPCWLPWNGLLAPLQHPAEAGFSSACSNDVDSFVLSVSLWIGCGMVQSQGFLWVTKTSFLLCPGLRVWWVNFLFTSLCFFLLFCFLSLCIAASGLHEGCWVCVHFNK